MPGRALSVPTDDSWPWPRCWKWKASAFTSVPLGTVLAGCTTYVYVCMCIHIHVYITSIHLSIIYVYVYLYRYTSRYLYQVGLLVDDDDMRILPQDIDIDI